MAMTENATRTPPGPSAKAVAQVAELRALEA